VLLTSIQKLFLGLTSLNLRETLTAWALSHHGTQCHLPGTGYHATGDLDHPLRRHYQVLP